MEKINFLELGQSFAVDCKKPKGTEKEGVLCISFVLFQMWKQTELLEQRKAGCAPRRSLQSGVHSPFEVSGWLDGGRKPAAVARARNLIRTVLSRQKMWGKYVQSDYSEEEMNCGLRKGTLSVILQASPFSSGLMLKQSLALIQQMSKAAVSGRCVLGLSWTYQWSASLWGEERCLMHQYKRYTVSPDV